MCPRNLLFFSLFSVLAIFTIVETALPDRSVLNGGNPVHLAVAWISLSVSLNIIVTLMICFRLLRARALTLGALSPEMSGMYTSIVAVLIESAAPFSVIGIGLVVTTAKTSPLTYAFSDIWSLFCVESKSSHTPSVRMPKANLTDMCLLFPSVTLPSNDYPPSCHGPWVAQGYCKGDRHDARIRNTYYSPSPRTKSRGTCNDVQYKRPQFWSWNACKSIGKHMSATGADPAV